MFPSTARWLLLVLTVAHQTRATRIVYPRMLEGRAERDLKLVKISDDITLSLQKSSIFSEEFFIHSQQDGVPIAYHVLHNRMSVLCTGLRKARDTKVIQILLRDPRSSVARDMHCCVRSVQMLRLDVVNCTTTEHREFAKEMSGPEMDKNLYHDEEHMASVHLSEENGISIEGVVGDKLRIKPMDGMERSADGQIPHRLYDISSAENEERFPDDYASSVQAWYTKLLNVVVDSECKICRGRDVTRWGRLPIEETSFPSLHRKEAVPNPNATDIMPESRLLWNRVLRMPVLIHPELHIVADYDISSALKFDEKKIARYLAILANSVVSADPNCECQVSLKNTMWYIAQANLRFRSMVQPRVQLVIVGITVTNKPSDEPYMVKVQGYEATKNILYSDTIAQFNNYVMKQSYFEQSDIIFLITGKNMSRWENLNLYANTGGFAYCGGACTKWRVGMIEERVGSYYGVFVFAHEIAHSLGCVHDGERANPWPAGHIGSEDCPYDAGYMMTYKFTAPNMYKFSPCCQREVLNIYNRPPYHCLSEKNSVEARVYSSKLPGEVSSRTTYCKLVYKSYSYVEADKKYDMSKCIVKCFIDKKGGNMLIGAVDGVHCGKKKVCVLGNCTHKPTIKKAE